jgi:3-hydroxybutyryl-CoA dehydrogenase
VRAVVVGTGLTAPFLALALRAAGADVRLTGRNPERAQAAAAAAGVDAVPLEAGTFADADFVLESVVEDFAVKVELLGRVEGWLGTGALLTTNTSGLSITRLAEPLARPGRFAGFHFLTPGHLTAVVEVIAGAATAPETVEALCELGRRMGKRPIVCRRDVPGFVWNRLQSALMREALWLIENGVADIESVDAAVSDGLAPRWLATGPFAGADLGNIRTWATVSGQLFPELSTETGAGELAARAGAGASFYAWDEASRGEVAELRADTLAAGRAFAERRRAATPPPA